MNRFFILLSPACTLSFCSLITTRWQLKEWKRWKRRRRSTMNQNAACFNFQWHVFPSCSGMFWGTMLIMIFYSANICMLLQQPVKLHKWEGKKEEDEEGWSHCQMLAVYLCNDMTVIAWTLIIIKRLPGEARGSWEFNTTTNIIIKRSSGSHSEDDYFPITACPQVFYSSDTTAVTLLIKEWHTVVFIHL